MSWFCQTFCWAPGAFQVLSPSTPVCLLLALLVVPGTMWVICRANCFGETGYLSGHTTGSYKELCIVSLSLHVSILQKITFLFTLSCFSLFLDNYHIDLYLQIASFTVTPEWLMNTVLFKSLPIALCFFPAPRNEVALFYFHIF